ncbi:MAG: tetratricopeptide repeat protein [Bryobacterales bacterium]|nr:tetratricopeptide repeat protein [Bryobacterales bacterium]
MTGLLLLFVAAVFASDEVGTKVCAECHASIVTSYARTGMARSAGAASTLRLSASGFVHAASGAEYRMTPNAGGIEMSFARGESKGRRLLEWFVGSGGLGRSFLFSKDGFLFQAPVSFYASVGAWQISPGYESRRHVDLTRAVETACLQCHASQLQPVAGTQNGFGNPPFREGGVSCERCHGGGRLHVENMRRGLKSTAIVHPAKLAADARDSLCAQCHLTGAARIARRNAPRYVPGAKLSDSLAVFVWPQLDASPDATSHYERLNRSACKKASGEKLWCGSCHDPHASPVRPAAHYREKCQSCHRTKPCTERLAVRNAKQNDCAACHMPKGESHMVEHVAFTDHGIVRRPQTGLRPAASRELSPFFSESDNRDLAMAYSVAAMTEPAVRRKALELLEAAVAKDATDVAVMAQLAQFYDRLGREEQAAALCEQILKLDPGHNAAAVNLGIYRVKRGDAAAAIALWKQALLRNPAQTGVRTNLAVALAQSGQLEAAEAELKIALDYDPSAEAAARLLAEIRTRR